MKIVSGGQTGVDRAALDAAIECDIEHGGWCPKGRLAEDGIIHERYHLQETGSEDYAVRTKCNIKDSDGTLILVPKLPLPVNISDGTILTINEVKATGKPHLVIEIVAELTLNTILTWIKTHHIEVLNIAGPRESQAPGIYQLSKQRLSQLFAAFK